MERSIKTSFKWESYRSSVLLFGWCWTTVFFPPNLMNKYVYIDIYSVHLRSHVLDFIAVGKSVDGKQLEKVHSF